MEQVAAAVVFSAYVVVSVAEQAAAALAVLPSTAMEAWTPMMMRTQYWLHGFWQS